MCYMSVMPFVKPGVTNSIEKPFLHHLFHCYSKKINKKNLAKMFKRRSSKMLTLVICQVVYKSVILRDDYLTGGLELKKEWESPL